VWLRQKHLLVWGSLFLLMSSGKGFNYYLLKANRLIVWVLLVLMILVIVSGYGLVKPSVIRSWTGGVIDFQTALLLHLRLMAPLLILLLVHVLIEVRFSLIRWGFKKRRLLDLLMIVAGLVCLVLIVYIELARSELWYLG